MANCCAPALSVAVIFALASSVGVQRTFSGNYTIVNWANGRKISLSKHGFTANKHHPVSDDSQWRFLPQGNDTFAISNCRSSMRMLAQSSMALETGFFAIDNGPIFEDQKWHLEIQRDGSYALINVRSGRRISATSNAEGAAGFFAIKANGPIREEERWWLINQEKDEAGPWFLQVGAVQNANEKLAEAFKAKVSELSVLSSHLKRSREQFDRDLAVRKHRNLVEQRVNLKLAEQVGQVQNETVALRTSLQLEMDGKAKLQEKIQSASAQIQNLSSQLHAEQFVRGALAEELDARKGVFACLTQFQSDDPGSHMSKLIMFTVVVAVASSFFPYFRYCLQAARSKTAKLAAELAAANVVNLRLAEENAEKQAKIFELERHCNKDVDSSSEATGELGFDFAFQVFNFDLDQSVMRLIKIQCPGVEHGDVQVQLIYNGCEVAIHRKASRGIEETTWRKQFSWKPSEGLYEFKEDQMQLEHGFLHLVFRAYPFQSRVIRFPQHFSLDSTDADLCWDYAAEQMTLVDDHSVDLIPVKPCSFIDTDSTASTPRKRTLADF